MKFWLFKYQVTIGEYSFTGTKVAVLKDQDVIDSHVETWLSDYFGIATTKDENGFWSPDGGANVKCSSVVEITESEYQVLNKYL